MRLVSIADSNKLAEVRSTWLSYLDDNDVEVLKTEYEQLFDLIGESNGWGDLDGRVNKAIYYLVVDDASDPQAIVELVQTRKGQDVWIKMIDITMAPKFETDDSTDATKEKIQVFSSALYGIFELTKHLHDVGTIKVYGRTEALITFLYGINASISAFTSLGKMQGIQVSFEGRWLVFRAINAQGAQT